MARDVQAINISKAAHTTNLFYFFFHGGKAAIVPFLTLFFRLLGLSALEAGSIIAAKTLTGLIWSPLWSRCATRWNRHRTVLIFSLFMMMVMYLSFPAMYTQVGTPEDCSGYNTSVLEQQVPELSGHYPNISLPSSVQEVTTEKPMQIVTPGGTTTETTPKVATTLPPNSETSQSNSEKDEQLNEVMNFLIGHGISMEALRKEAGSLNLTENDLSKLEAMYQERTGHGVKKRSAIAFSKRDWLDVGSGLKEKLLSIQDTLRSDKVLIFLVLLAVVVGGEIFASPVEKVADDAWFDFLNRIDDLERYGQQRFWGSIAFVLVPIAVTVAVENTPCFLPFNLHHYLLHFYVFVFLTAAAMIVACWYPVPPPSNAKASSKVCKGLRIICCDGRGFLFSITLLLTGMVYASYHNFLFWRVQDMGGNEIIMGLCVSAGAFAEIPMLLMSTKLVKKMGNCWVVSVALLILSLRVIYYAFIPLPWALVPIELTHGFTHTALWFAILSYEEFNVGAALDRNLRTILSSMYFGIGFSTGSVLSGLIFDRFGASYLFIGCSIVVGIWLVLFTLIQKCLPQKEKVRYIKLMRSDSDNSDEEEDDWLEMALKDH